MEFSTLVWCSLTQGRVQMLILQTQCYYRHIIISTVRYCCTVLYSITLTSGQSNLTQDCRWTVQLYSSGGANVPSHMGSWAHWRHLANMIELLLPSAHLSPQLKRQIDRFSHFCTAHGKVNILYNEQSFPPKLPLPMGIWTPI